MAVNVNFNSYKAHWNTHLSFTYVLLLNPGSIFRWLYRLDRVAETGQN